MNWCIVSTLPHFCSIAPLIGHREATAYIYVITVSSTLSVLYHLYEESNTIITAADYLAAATWSLFDVYMGYTHTNTSVLSQIILGNLLIFALNLQIPRDESYIWWHSLWHYLSAYKSFYVSSLIGYSANFKPPIPETTSNQFIFSA